MVRRHHPPFKVPSKPGSRGSFRVGSTRQMITELIFEFGFSGSFLFTPCGTRAGFLAGR